MTTIWKALKGIFKPLMAECIICERELPETEGSYSLVQYNEDTGEDESFFVCKDCKTEADRILDRYESGEGD
jgi:hypothetical protein